VRAQNAPGRKKVCRHVLSRGWQVLFLGPLARSLLRVRMCIWDYLIFLFKDPRERIQARWSSPLSPVMHPSWRLIVWFCKMRLNLCQSKPHRSIVILLSRMQVHFLLIVSSIVSFPVVSHPKANCVTQYVAHDIYNLFICQTLIVKGQSAWLFWHFQMPYCEDILNLL